MAGSGERPKRTRIDAGAASIGALLYGEATNPPVVLLHGWADSAWSMDRVADPLGERYRVISLDLRGHGHSDRGPYNLLNLVGDLRGVIEALNLVAPIIIGHSLGGQVAAQFCGLYPDIPAALALIEGIGPPPHRLAATDPDRMEREFALRQVERTRRPPRVKTLPSVAAAADRLRAAHPLLDEERVQLLAAENTVAVDDGVQWRFDPASRDWFNGHNQENAAQRWRGITCPVLVVNGGDSYERYWRFIQDDPEAFPEPLTGAALQARLANFADVRYTEIAGAGHMLPYDKPVELNNAIGAFLSELSPRR
ncbi:MAG: alpha/beta hydrolase [Actinomycetota bacterium]